MQQLIGDKHITETMYFLTDDNIVVDIDNDLDRKDVHVKKAIDTGAILKNIFYVDDSNFSEHTEGFTPKGIWNCVEHAKEHGVFFEKESDARKYEEYINVLNYRDEFLKEIKDIDVIKEIYYCKKIGKVVAPEFTCYLSNDDDDIREISESKTNKVYKRGVICPLGTGYLIYGDEWQWLEYTNEYNFDTIYIIADGYDDKLTELCDYTIGGEEVGGSCDKVIYINVVT